MTSTSQAGTGPFLLKLCHLSAPVSIRPPESPHLKPFTFFVGRTTRPDGGQELSLNMGYFETLAAAQKWLRLVRGRYPHAVAMPTPAAFLPQPAAVALRAAPETLTDTQVMRILETRGVAQPRGDTGDDDGARVVGGQISSSQIPLVRPEDTATRLALQEAVAQGAPVSFAVQLQWSAQPIDPGRVSSAGAFKDHVLYVTQSTRDGRSRYFLRLGFFDDPVAARQVAFQVRTKFSGAVIVPVAEQERRQAYEPYSASPVTPPGPATRPGPTARSKITHGASRNPRKGAETLDQTLELLAKREMWTDPDTVSESGVRHLKVEVQERRSRGS